MARNIPTYATSEAIAAPKIPYGGTSATTSTTFTTAAAPVITQLNCVFRARPTPITTTVYDANAAALKQSGATVRSAPAYPGLLVRMSTIQGARTESAVEIQQVSSVRWVRTNP